MKARRAAIPKPWPRWLFAAGLLLLAAAFPIAAQQGPDNEPAAAQGYTNNVFHSSSVDSINAFNGQLTIPLPVGPSYPVGPTLKFQATLTYNSKVWEHGHPHGSGVPAYDFWPVRGDPALGIGWTFTIGKIGWCGPSSAGRCYFGPDGSETLFGVDLQNLTFQITQDASQLRLTPPGPNGPYVMWDGDGNEYSFGWPVTGYDDDPQVGNGYIRDYGRGRDGWYLTSIKDRFNNQILIDYYSAANPCPVQYFGSCPYATQMNCGGAGNSWIPHFVKTQSSGGAVVQALEVILNPSTKMIQSLNFKWYRDSGLVEQTATWNLEYSTVDFLRGLPNCDTARLQMLQAIRLPADIAGTLGYRFDYHTTQGFQGLIRTMTLPTDAAIRYDYGNYHFYQGRQATIEEGSSCGLQPPPPGTTLVIRSFVQTAGGGANAPIGGPEAPSGPCLPGSDQRQYTQTTAGVLRRTVTGSTLEEGQTDYTQYSMPHGETGDTGAQTLTVVLRPADVDGRRRAEAILFWAAPVTPEDGAHPGDQTGADLRRSVHDYDPNQGVPGGLLFNIPVCGGSADELCPNHAVRNTQRVFSYTLGDINRRVGRETVYYGTITNTDATADDYCPACAKHTVTYSPDNTWEANGRHYTTEAHSGNFSFPYGSDDRTVTTIWDPKTTPWMRNLYTQRTTTQASTIDERSEFDANNGFLKGSSVFDSARQLTYLNCRYPNSDGTLNQYFSARYPNYGPPSVTACTENYSSYPTSVVGTNGDAFGKTYTYESGQLKTARWVNGGASVAWFSEKYDRAPRTGWILARYDTANLATTYVYDSLGRVLTVTPPGGEVATNIAYPSPTQTNVTREGGAGLSTRLEYTYDNLGRLTKERRRIAGGQFVKRFRKYDPAGHEYFQSEWVTDGESEVLSRDQSETCAIANDPTFIPSYSGLRPSLAPGTFRVCFDPFGRPREVIGSKTSSRVSANRNDGTNWYTDTVESVTTHCVNGSWNPGTCSGSDSTTTTRRDAFGRVTAVTEPDGVLTTYAHDANDKVTAVCQGVQGAGICQGVQGSQNRTFSYDAAGYLRFENTPEKGVITYDDYGTLGNVLFQTEPGGLVRATCYDFAGRVRQVRTNEGGLTAACLPSSTGRQYFLNTFNDATPGNSLGKLTQRTAVRQS